MLQTYDVTLSKRQKLTDSTYLLTFSLPQGKILEFEAGQYMIFFIPGTNPAEPHRRLFSIVTPPAQTSDFEIVMDYIPLGVASEYFTTLTIGARVSIAGPAGRFFLHQSNRKKIFLATGSGIGPILSIITTHVESDAKQQFILLWGLATKNEIYFKMRLDLIRLHHPNFTYLFCFSKEIVGNGDIEAISGYVQQGFDAYIAQSPSRSYVEYDYYVCGGLPQVEDIRAHLYLRGAPREQVYFERFV